MINETRTLLGTVLIGRLEQEAGQICGWQGIPPAVVPVDTPVLTMDADGPVEVCVPVNGAVEPVDDIRVRVEPGHSEAYARITKAQVAYPEILEAYDSVHAWLEKNGKETGNWSPREVYFADWATLSDDDPACDVAWPFEG